MEDIHYHLYVREKVERGISATEEGRVVSQEEAEQKVKDGWASVWCAVVKMSTGFLGKLGADAIW